MEPSGLASALKLMNFTAACRLATLVSAAALGSVTTRETMQAAALTSAEAALNAQGLCPLNLSARYARGRLRIPYGASWSFALGLEPQFVPEGLQ